MRMYLYVASLVMLVLCFPALGEVESMQKTAHVVWDRVPIRFIVPVHAERMLIFPEPVALQNKNPALTGDKVALLNNAGTLYITAKKEFAPIRIAVQLQHSGKVVLVDLSAQKHAEDTPLEVVLKSEKPEVLKHAATSATIDYPYLMRYAIQHLYAPESLVKDDPAIMRVPMYTSKSVALGSSAAVISMPLVSWRAGDLYITAVLLKNTLTHAIHLNPMHLHGAWKAASFYPTSCVTAKGTLHDRTTIFLISDQPFQMALDG